MVKLEVLDNFEIDQHTRNDHGGNGNAFDWINLAAVRPDSFFMHFFVTAEYEQSNDERKRHLDLRKRRGLKHPAQLVVEVSKKGQEQAWAAEVEHLPVCWWVCRMKIGVIEWIAKSIVEDCST